MWEQTIAIMAATIIGPMAAVIITLWHQDRSQSKERKTQLLRQITIGRRLPGDISYSLALTLIPIEFARHTDVIEAHRILSDSLTGKRPQDTPADQDNLFADMIVKMSKVLGYKFEHATVRSLGFISDGLQQRDILYLESLVAQKTIANALTQSAHVGIAVAQKVADATPLDPGELPFPPRESEKKLSKD